MVSPAHWRTPLDDVPWAFDNGAYSAFVQGKPFDLEKFVRHLVRLVDHKEPDFIVVPDIVGGGFQSLQFSLTHVDTLWGHVPGYLAVQDGMTIQDVEPVIRFFQGLFVGGSCETNRRGNRVDLDPVKARSQGWKWETAQGWVQLAHKHGKRCHIGKVGTYHDILQARAFEADSIDSTSWAVNDKHWVPEAALAAPVKPVRVGDYGALAEIRVCGVLMDDEDAGLCICRLDQGHASEHAWQPFYEATSPPIMARDQGPGVWLEFFEGWLAGGPAIGLPPGMTA